MLCSGNNCLLCILLQTVCSCADTLFGTVLHCFHPIPIPCLVEMLPGAIHHWTFFQSHFGHVESIQDRGIILVLWTEFQHWAQQLPSLVFVDDSPNSGASSARDSLLDSSPESDDSVAVFPSAPTVHLATIHHSSHVIGKRAIAGLMIVIALKLWTCFCVQATTAFSPLLQTVCSCADTLFGTVLHCFHPIPILCLVEMLPGAIHHWTFFQSHFGHVESIQCRGIILVLWTAFQQWAQQLPSLGFVDNSPDSGASRTIKRLIAGLNNKVR